MVVKKRLRLNKKSKGVLLIIVILIVSVFSYNIYNVNKINYYQELGYSKDTIKTIEKYNLKDYVSARKNNLILNNVLSSSYFNKNNLSIYEVIIYKENIDIAKYVNLLKDKNYSSEEIKNIIKCGGKTSLNKFVEEDYSKVFNTFLKIDGAKLSLLDEYILHQKKTFSMASEVVMTVNLGINKDVYTDTIIVDSQDINILVNKYRELSDKFMPNDLVNIENEYSLSKGILLRSDVYDNFKKLSNDAKKDNLNIVIRAGYRSHTGQQSIFDYYKNLYGVNRADSLTARAGFSEHQTGLAIDVAQNSTSVFVNTLEYKWMLNNAHKYGFINRFSPSKEKITKFSNEPWHYRYVGIDIATKIYESKLSYEEYYFKYIEGEK